MSDIFSALSTELANAVDAIAPSVVQLHGRRRQVAGVAFDTDLILAPSHAVDQEAIAVRRADGQTFEGTAVGRSGTGVAVVRVPDLGVPVARVGSEPRPGHLALAVGRTWSGNVFSALAPVAVVGGPLRTGRRSELERVIRVGIAPHGALTGGALVDGSGALLGLVTAAAIRGTTVVIPAALAIASARELVAGSGKRHGFIGITSLPVRLPERQRAGGGETGVLVTGLSAGGPAEAAGILVGDVIVSFDGQPVADHDDLLAQLHGDRIGKPVSLSVVRGGTTETVTVTIGERQR
jgi:S1-C subfamily serine protease